MRVQDLLQDGAAKVASLPPTATALEAAQRMTEERQGSVLVTESDALLGIFTERDLMTRVVAVGKDPAQTALREVMSSELFIATLDRTVSDLRRELRQRHIRHVPVVSSEGRVVAVLSLRDLLRADLAETRSAARDMEDYIRGNGY